MTTTTNTNTTVIEGFDGDGIAQVATPEILAELLRDSRYEYGGRSNWTPTTVTVKAAAIVTVNGVAYAAETLGAAEAFVAALGRPSIFSGVTIARKCTITAL